MTLDLSSKTNFQYYYLVLLHFRTRVLVNGRLEYVSYDDDDGSRKSYSSIVMGIQLYCFPT